MLSYRLGTVNYFHWEFKPVLSYSKPHTFSTFLEKKKKEKMHLISPTRPRKPLSHQTAMPQRSKTMSARCGIAAEFT